MFVLYVYVSFECVLLFLRVYVACVCVCVCVCVCLCVIQMWIQMWCDVTSREREREKRYLGFFGSSYVHSKDHPDPFLRREVHSLEVK